MHISVDIFHQIAILLWFSMCVFFSFLWLQKKTTKIFALFSFDFHSFIHSSWNKTTVKKLFIYSKIASRQIFDTYRQTVDWLIDWLIDWSPWPPKQDNIICFPSIYQTEKNLRSGFFSFLCFWLSKSFYYDVLNFCCCCCCDYIRNSCSFFGSVFISPSLTFLLSISHWNWLTKTVNFYQVKNLHFFSPLEKWKLHFFLLCSNNDDHDVDGVLWKNFFFLHNLFLLPLFHHRHRHITVDIWPLVFLNFFSGCLVVWWWWWLLPIG